MTMKRLSLVVAASAVSLMVLSGCTNNFRADVSRFQQLPPSQGQTFSIRPESPQLAGGLEFDHYAQLVSERMVAQGYQPASDPASAQLIVRMDYGVDRGRERIRSTGGAGFSGFGGWGGGWGPGWGPGYGRGWGPAWGGGWRGRYMMGFNDPFMWGSGFNDVSSYTVYGSQLRLRIDKTGGGRVFEGTARAQSVSNKLTYLVPNLIDAMFTGFPGNNGEEIKVTVAPEPRDSRRN